MSASNLISVLNRSICMIQHSTYTYIKSVAELSTGRFGFYDSLIGLQHQMEIFGKLIGDRPAASDEMKPCLCSATPGANLDLLLCLQMCNLQDLLLLLSLPSCGHGAHIPFELSLTPHISVFSLPDGYKGGMSHLLSFCELARLYSEQPVASMCRSRSHSAPG